MRSRSASVLAVLLACIHAQEPAAPTPAVHARAAAYAAMLAELDREPLQTISQRQRLLLDFLAAHVDAPDSPEVLGARLRFGTLALQRLDARTALEMLTEVATRAEAVDRDLRARALFGQHQAHVLAHEIERAREVLHLLIKEHADDSAGEAAKLALAHLEAEHEATVGKPMPQLAFGVDLADRRVDASTFVDGPRLYVFWSLAHEPSQRRLEACARVWRKLGLPEENLLAYAVDDDVGALRRLAQQRRWTFRVLPAGAGAFLNPDWIRLSVTAVPTTMLVGADDVLLATDLPPDRLESLLRGN